jgi:hypothetical protein
MSNDVRPVGLGFGLVLGLVLASPWLSPSILPWAVEALFLLSAFLVRLSDRRWHRRKGFGGWISDMRMMPSRLLPWAAVAVVAFIARAPGVTTTGVVVGALSSELLLYPLLSSVIGRTRPGAMAAAIVGMLVLQQVSGLEALRYACSFGLGALLCAFWLRGPDGEPRELALALGGAGLLTTIGWIAPFTAGWTITGAIGCATLALAHLSMLRSRVTHWRVRDALKLRPARPHPRLLP